MSYSKDQEKILEKEATDRQIKTCLENESYLKKLRNKKMYKKCPTELTKYNSL